MKTRHEPRLQNGHGFSSAITREVALKCGNGAFALRLVPVHIFYAPQHVVLQRVLAIVEASVCLSVTLCCLIKTVLARSNSTQPKFLIRDEATGGGRQRLLPCRHSPLGAAHAARMQNDTV